MPDKDREISEIKSEEPSRVEDESIRRKNTLQLREDEQSDKNEKRYKYANRFVWIATVSLIFVAAVLIATGSKSIPFELGNSVLIAILGTALANVLAPVYLLARYLFNNNSDG